MRILPQPTFLRQLAGQLGDCLLPGSCLLCGSDSPAGLLCPECAADLPYAGGKLCPQCGEPTTHGERCGACLQAPPAFDRTDALLVYSFPADRLIHALKYGHQLAIAGWLGARLAERLADHPCDAIVPLPLHPGRLAERGFNQAQEIARNLGKELHRPLTGFLHRVRATPPQAELPLKQRVRNVRGAFACNARIDGQHIMLVDDVMTSGATLDECARVLKRHGAARVDVVVAARAMKH